MIKIGICGAAGKMGQTILKVLLEKGHSLAAAFDIENCPYIGQDAGTVASQKSQGIIINTINNEDTEKVDGIIDFSLPGSLPDLLKTVLETKKPLVIGTTGLSEKEISEIEKASEEIPIVLSPNMSLGVNLLFKLTELVTRSLNKDFDIEIYEAHHRLKKDAPSGTAKKLLEIVKNSREELNKADEIYDRTPVNDPRGENEIGMMSLRGGDIVGEHTVYFAGIGERLELTHRASSRETFARGAVQAMEFVINKKTGLYNTFDVLGL